MRRRILLAIIGVTTLATIVLSIPLGLIISHREVDDAFRELDRIAERTAAGLPRSLAPGHEPIQLPRVESAISIGVYNRSATLVAGAGPRRADRVTAKARVVTRMSTVDGDQVVARPLTLDDHRLAVVRVSEGIGETTARIRDDLLILALIDLGAIAVAAVVGSVLATRMVRPLREIRDNAVHLGHGDFSIQPASSGVAELDETAAALAETAQRLDGVMRREREFTVNASHQLRTPIAAMRLSIESEILTPRVSRLEVLEEALVEIDRLEVTIQTLLAFARDRPSRRDTLDVDAAVTGLRARWDGPLVAAGRRLVVTAGSSIGPYHLSAHVLDQILDVLIGNALAHGRGAVSVTIAERASNLAVTVSDEGEVHRDAAELFVRRHVDADHHGVGLALARTLAEAEGGRLTLAHVAPTTFLLLLPDLRDQSGERKVAITPK